jgi:microcystin degradation protein MlrC
MRVAVGGFMHETNTFITLPTTWDNLVRAGPWLTVAQGEAIRSESCLQTLIGGRFKPADREVA